MAKYPDNAFDFAIVDPPYGKGLHTGTEFFKNQQRGADLYGKKKHEKTWDKKPPDENYFFELFRVSKNQLIWGGNYFRLKPSPVVFVWTKTNEIQGYNYGELELLWTSLRSPHVCRFLDYRPFIRKGTRIHPTQKPVRVYKWILSLIAKEGDSILDTHMGSGSLAIACHDMRFDFVGCEIDKDYFLAAQKRVKDHQSQKELF